jgi:hypothetical protein
MLAAVVSILITKRLMEKYDSFPITASTIVLGTIVMALWVMLSWPGRFRFSPETWTARAAQGCLQALAPTCFGIRDWLKCQLPARESFSTWSR